MSNDDEATGQAPAEVTPEPAAPAPAPTGTQTGTASSSEADDHVSVRRILRTTTWCAVVAAIGHLLIYANYAFRTARCPQPQGPSADSAACANWIPWQAPVGVAMAVVGILAFGGFYAASRRARVAIVAAYLLSFLVLLSFELSIVELSRRTTGTSPEGLVDLVKDLRSSLGIIVGFYFGSEAAISVAKAIGVAFGDNAERVMTSDRDVAATGSSGDATIIAK